MVPTSRPTVITDGTWHRVGFVWDGSKRTLYVDDVEVGSDTQSSLAASAGGGAETWTGRIVDKIAYNWYHVQPVCVLEVGSLPFGLGAQRTACNLGESFDEEGTLAAYTYVVFWHVGDYYVFDRPA
jgi:hypothetical protein